MSKLFKKQVQFGLMLPRLLRFIQESGYQYTIGQTVRCPDCSRGHERSLHKKALAVDINLFAKDGTYLQNGKDHEAMHDFWDSIGGAERIAGDLNHYSVEYGGMR